MHHLRGDEPGIAEQFGRLRRRGPRPAHRARRRRRPAGPGARTAAPHRPKSRAGRPAAARKSGVPRRSLPKWKLKPITAPVMARRSTRMSCDEFLGAEPGQRRVEGQHDRAVEPGRGQQPELGGLRGEVERRLVGLEEGARMRLEGQHRRRAVGRLRALASPCRSPRGGRDARRRNCRWRRPAGPAVPGQPSAGPSSRTTTKGWGGLGSVMAGELVSMRDRSMPAVNATLTDLTAKPGAKPQVRRP